MTTRVCGSCRECCIAFPLLKDDTFWRDGKRAYTPCRHLCEAGCGIHNQERPHVCTDYQCGWLQGVLPDAWRPNDIGFIAGLTRLANCIGHWLPDYNGYPADTDVIQVVECRKDALLETPSDKLRYRIDRAKAPWRLVVIVPYGVDVMYHPTYWRMCPPMWIAWNAEDDSYAELLTQWWFGGLVRKARKVSLPLVGAA